MVFFKDHISSPTSQAHSSVPPSKLREAQPREPSRSLPQAQQVLTSMEDTQEVLPAHAPPCKFTALQYKFTSSNWPLESWDKATEGTKQHQRGRLGITTTEMTLQNSQEVLIEVQNYSVALTAVHLPDSQGGPRLDPRVHNHTTTPFWFTIKNKNNSTRMRKPHTFLSTYTSFSYFVPTLPCKSRHLQKD